MEMYIVIDVLINDKVVKAKLYRGKPKKHQPLTYKKVGTYCRYGLLPFEFNRITIYKTPRGALRYSTSYIDGLGVYYGKLELIDTQL
jgi:hypothetical protein